MPVQTALMLMKKTGLLRTSWKRLDTCNLVFEPGLEISIPQMNAPRARLSRQWSTSSGA
jgi:hypothetical protein